MERYSVKFKKKFGQNFLKEVNTVKKIVSVADMKENSLVIEVGPGGAIMTRELASVADHVLAYEIDTELKDELSSRLVGLDNVEVLFMDFLKADLEKDIEKYHADHIYFVSNVPYYITTPILMKIMDSGIPFEKIVMMVQKEVGDRFSMTPGNREYGSITVLLHYFYDVKKEFLVSRKQFVPEPNVDSVIVSFREIKDKLPLKSFDTFQKLIRDSFQYKRKNLRNNLKGYDLNLISSILEKYGYDLNVRAEQLGVEVFVDIANAI